MVMYSKHNEVRIVKSFTNLFRPKMLIAGVMLAVISVFGANLLTHNSVSAACGNDIICGGVTSPSQLVNVYNSRSELQTLYNSDMFGKIAPDNGVSRFAAGQVHSATAYKNGKLILDDGRVVLTNAFSPGYHGGNPGDSNPNTVVIGGVTYHWGYNSTAFMSDGLKALVLMDKDDKYMQFSVLTSCGNPMQGTKPVFQCDMLNKKQVSDTEFKFWTAATARQGATVKSFHYDFGDGTTADDNGTSTDEAHAVSHTYAQTDQEKSYHITVTVTYDVNGVTTQEKIQIHCQTDITVKPKVKPVSEFACTLLQPIDEGSLKFKFNGSASFKNTDITAATFNFGDDQSGAGTVSNKTSTSADITAEHTFADFTGTKTITLSVDFKNGSDTHNAKCQTSIKHEVLPAAIVRTGPEQILGGAIGFGSLAGAGMYYRASRKNISSLLDKFKR